MTPRFRLLCVLSSLLAGQGAYAQSSANEVVLVSRALGQALVQVTEDSGPVRFERCKVDLGPVDQKGRFLRPVTLNGAVCAPISSQVLDGRDERLMTYVRETFVSRFQAAAPRAVESHRGTIAVGWLIAVADSVLTLAALPAFAMVHVFDAPPTVKVPSQLALGAWVLGGILFPIYQAVSARDAIDGL